MSGRKYYELACDSTLVRSSAVAGSLPSNTPLFEFPNDVRDVRKFKILSTSIPYSWYTLTTDATLRFYWNSGATAYYAQVTVPAASYTAANYTSTVTTLFNALPSSTWTSGGMTLPVTISTTISPTTGILSFTVTSSATVPASSECKLYFGTDNIASMTGNTSREISGTLNAGPTVYTITLPAPANFVSGNVMYIASRTLGPLLPSYLPQGPYHVGNSNVQICSVPITGNFGDIMTWDNHAGEWFDANNLQNLDRFDLFVTSGFDDFPIDFRQFGFTVKIGLMIGGEISQYQKPSYGNDRNLLTFQA